MNGKICQSCVYNDEKGICRLSPEQMEYLLNYGWCSDIACTLYECREDAPTVEEVPQPDPIVPQEDPRAVFDRLDEQRRRSLERED